MSNALVKSESNDIELIISPDKSLIHASQSEKEAALTQLFVGLTNVITKHDCSVDISDPLNIKVKKNEH